MKNIGDSVFKQLGLALLEWRWRMSPRRSRGVRAAARRVGVSSATLSRVERGHKCDAGTFLRVVAIVCPQQTEALVVAIARASKGGKP